MKKLFYILTLLTCTSIYGQLNKLKGKWITIDQDVIIIADTSNSFNRNYLSNTLLESENFELVIIGDTLSFRKTFYSLSGTNKIKGISRDDLKVINLTDSIMELRPVSTLSKSFFQNRAKLVFTKQEFASDSSIQFEKIVFKSSKFLGFPIYHLQIDKSKLLLLHSPDGYFTKKLSDTSFQKILNAIQTCNLRTLRMSNELCCDGPLTTIIVYFNGKRKYFKTMFPPKIVGTLIQALFDVCEEDDLRKTSDSFKLEE